MDVSRPAGCRQQFYGLWYGVVWYGKDMSRPAGCRQQFYGLCTVPAGLGGAGRLCIRK